VLGGLLSSALYLSTASCSSFSGAPDDGTVDGGTGVSEGGGATDASSSDAPPDGGAVGFPPCLSPSCEDFESATWRLKWALAGDPILDVNNGASTSGTRALDMLVPNTDQKAILVRKAGAATKGLVAVSVNVIVAERGDGELDFINLVESADIGAKGVHIVHDNASNGYAVEYPITGDKKMVVSIAQPFAGFTTVKMEVTIATSSLVVTAGGDVIKGELDPAWKPADLYFALGSAYAKVITKPWHIRFDDAALLASP